MFIHFNHFTFDLVKNDIVEVVLVVVGVLAPVNRSELEDAVAVVGAGAGAGAGLD